MQFPRAVKFRLCMRRTSVPRIWLCWLLCLSVWRGPIPVVHEHAIDVASLANNSQLAEHAIAYHSESLGHEGLESTCSDHKSTGLHFHFMLLDHCSDLLLTDSCSSSQHVGSAVVSILNAEQEHRDILELNAAQLNSFQGDSPRIAEDLRFSSTAKASFLQTQLLCTPAKAVLCVCLC